MKAIKLLVSILVTPLFLFAGNSNKPLSPINLKALKKLSSDTFKIDVDKAGMVRLSGSWPKVCAQSVSIATDKNEIGLGLQVRVNQECVNLLKLSPRQISKLPKTPIAALFKEHVLNAKEMVYIESNAPKLDLHFDYEDLERANSMGDSVFLKKPIEGSSEQATRNLNPESSHHEEHFESSIKYRKCLPSNYGSTNQSFCNDRFGLDLNADIPLRPGTKIIGTTMVDVIVPERLQDSFAENLGVNVQVIQEISDSVGGR